MPLPSVVIPKLTEAAKRQIKTGVPTPQKSDNENDLILLLEGILKALNQIKNTAT